MRRPLAVIGFTGLLALVFAAFFGESMAFWAAAGIAVLSLVFLAVGIFCPRFRRYKAVLVACVAAVVFFSSYVLCVQLRVRPVQALDGQSAEIEGVVCELPYESYGKYYYELEVRRVDLEGAPQNFKLRVSSSHALGADIYDKIDATVTFYLPQDGQGFSSRSYAQAQGLYVYAFLHEYEGVGVQKTGERPLYYYALRARQAMTQALFELLPEEQAGLACGVLLGSKQYVPDRVNTDFRDIGVSHLLAVSGMHMAVIGQLLLVLGRALRLPKVLRVIFAAAGVFGFMAVTGFVPSVSRAGIMMLLYLLGLLLGRQPDTLTSLGAAVLILIALNPMAGGDIGLLLSFCATLGMILFAGPIDAWLKQKLAAKAGWAQRLVFGVCGALSATVSATLTTLPVLLAVFGEISLISPLANLLLVFPCTVFLLVVAVAGLCWLTGFLSFVAYPLAIAGGLLANYQIACSAGLARIPYVSLSAGQGFVLLWLAGTGVLLAICLLSRNCKRLLRLTGLLSCILLLVGIFSYQVANRNELSVAVLDSGDGCAVVVTNGGRAAVLSCGGSYLPAGQIDSYLSRRNIRQLDYLLIPDWTPEASSGITDVIAGYRPAVVLLPGSETLDEPTRLAVQANGGINRSFSGALEVSLWGELQISCAGGREENSLLLSGRGVTFLITPSGEAGENAAGQVDFYITGGQGDPGVQAAYTIFSLSEDSLQRCWAQPVPSGWGNMLGTGGQGSVVVRLYGDRTVSVLREW